MTGRLSQKRCLAWFLMVGGMVASGLVSAGRSGGWDTLAMIFNFSSLGGDTPGERGDIKIKFVNSTPYRAVFTFGTYDPLNTEPVHPQDTDAEYTVGFAIKFGQFVVNTDEGGTRLNAFSESEVITFTASSTTDPGGCGRAISVGGAQLVDLIEKDTTLLEQARLEALKPLCNSTTDKPKAGIAFFLETSEGPGEDACETADEVQAWAEEVLTLQGQPINSLAGIRYPCDGTVTYTFVQDSDQPGGIRVDVDVEPPPEEEEE